MSVSRLVSEDNSSFSTSGKPNIKIEEIVNKTNTMSRLRFIPRLANKKPPKPQPTSCTLSPLIEMAAFALAKSLA